MSRPKRVMIAGGGTGGHVFPGLAVAEALKRVRRDCEIRFVGTDRGLENKVIPGAGFDLWTLPVRGMPRRPGLAQLNAAVQFVRSLVITFAWFTKWRPDVILGTGGYVSAPPIVVGRLFRIPILLQEQNAVPGAVNRLLSRLATEVHVNFAGARRFFRRRDHLRLSGNPLRPGLLAGSRNRAYERFGLSPKRQTVVVLGGSAGASSINRAIADAASKIETREPLQFLVQSGESDLAWMRERLETCPFPAKVLAFVNQIDDAYTVADVIVCRAGAMTVSEVAATGVPAIFVPYPYATDNHQRLNAEEMVDRGAALMILDAELDGDRLAAELQTLIRDPIRRRRMASSARGSARFDAADVIASALLARIPEPRADEAAAGDEDRAARGASDNGKHRGRGDGRGRDRRQRGSRASPSRGGSGDARSRSSRARSKPKADEARTADRAPNAESTKDAAGRDTAGGQRGPRRRRRGRRRSKPAERD